MRWLAVVVLPLVAAAQPTSNKTAATSFEAASIKPASPDAQNSGFDTDTGLVRVQNQTLRRLVGYAYQVNDAQITGGPKWVEADRFDVVGKASGPADTPELRQMMQALLADRFKLAFHHESKTVTGYALTVAKSGVRMETSQSKDSSSQGGRGRIDAQGLSMPRLAERLTRVMGVPVEDATGLAGGFNFSLKWTAEERADSGSKEEAPSIFTAIQEQLGLKLESRKVTLDVLVIDGAEKPGEN